MVILANSCNLQHLYKCLSRSIC